MTVFEATGRVALDLAKDTYWNFVEVNKFIHTFKHTTVRNTFFFHVISFNSQFFMKTLSLQEVNSYWLNLQQFQSK